MFKSTAFGCVICDDDLGKAPENSDDESLTAIPCGHVFHNNCLQQWMTTGTGTGCPQCRKVIPFNGLIPLFLSNLEMDNSAINRSNLESALLRSKLEEVEKQLADSKELCQVYTSVNQNLDIELAKEKTISKDYLVKLESCKSFVEEKNKECEDLEEKMGKINREKTDLEVEIQRLKTKLSNIRILTDFEKVEVPVFDIMDSPTSGKSEAVKPARKRRR